ncbi:MAG TPA: MCP four helix bundle domain-containing protein, partial [Candidatus Sulfotelmatobacter sp.]|nr:MCP four helix bundle domain-containing protein [Candidatus Sulfotelmatobacter sp.]
MSLPFLGRLTIGGKLGLGFAILTILALGLGFFALHGMSDMRTAEQLVNNDYLPSVGVVGRVGITLERYRVKQGYVVLNAGTSLQAESEAQRAKARDEFFATLADYKPLVDQGWETANYAKIADDAATYRDSMDAPLDALLAKHDIAGARALYMGSGLEKMEGLRAAVTAAIDYNNRTGHAASDASAATYGSTRTFTLAALAIVTLAALTTAFLLMRDIARPLVATRGAMDKMAAGDLLVAIPGAGRRDEIGAMAASLEAFRAGLTESERLAAETRTATEARAARAARIDTVVA